MLQQGQAAGELARVVGGDDAGLVAGVIDDVDRAGQHDEELGRRVAHLEQRLAIA